MMPGLVFVQHLHVCLSCKAVGLMDLQVLWPQSTDVQLD